MADFQAHLYEFGVLDTAVVALSTEQRTDAVKLVADLRLTYPVLTEIDVAEVGERFGAYTSERGFVHATGFVVRPDGTIELAVYSSGSRGRIVAADAVELLRARQAR